MAMGIDLFPTLTAIAGAPISDTTGVDGKDISDLLMGGQVSPHEKLIFFHQGQVAAIRTERYRFVTEVAYLGRPRSRLARLASSCSTTWTKGQNTILWPETIWI